MYHAYSHGNVENRVRLVSDRYAAHLHVTPTTTATADDVFALRAKATDVQELDHGHQEVLMRDIPAVAVTLAHVQVIRVDGVQSTRAELLTKPRPSC